VAYSISSESKDGREHGSVPGILQMGRFYCNIFAAVEFAERTVAHHASNPHNQSPAHDIEVEKSVIRAGCVFTPAGAFCIVDRL